jgi:hypothetical protein
MTLRIGSLLTLTLVAAAAACSSSSGSSGGDNGDDGGGASSSGASGSGASSSGASSSGASSSGASSSGASGSGASSSGASSSGASSSGASSSGASSSGASSSSSGGSSSSSSGSSSGDASSTTCGSATLFAGNPNFADPSERPSDGANILTGTPYLYQLFHFATGGQILTNDQLSVWRIDTSNSELHAVAGGPLTGNAELLAAASPGLACGSARFADLLGSAMDSHGNIFVADYANAILEVTSPLNASACMVSYFAGTATEIDSPSLDQTDGNSGTQDGTGSAAQFMGPQGLTIDGTDNLYVLDHATAWSIRKITPGAVVSTLATFSDDQYAYGELQYLDGKVWFWARGNDSSDEDTANLIAIDPTATSPVVNPPSLLTLHGADLGGDSTAGFEIGGITTDGTKLYVEALGQIFTVDVSGTTPVLSAPLAGENDDNWSTQNNLDFASSYDPTATQTAASVELLALDDTQTLGVYSYLSRDSTGNLYFTAESSDVYVEKIAGCP